MLTARTPPLDPQIHASVRAAQMRMLFDDAVGASVAATAFAFALAWHLSGTVADRLLFTWLAIKCIAVIPRMIHSTMFSRRRDDSLRWLSWGRGMLVVDGLAWGSAGVLLMPPQDIATMTVVVATLSGVVAIATFVIHTDWESCVAFTVPTLLPCIVYFFSRFDEFGLYGGMSILTFLILLLAVARRSERHVVELLELRFANARLTQQLSAALDKANNDSRSKDIFVANMSHELRTPLHGILGLSRTLLSSVRGAEREAVALIRRSGDHLLGLINNILEYSRFEAHGIDLHPQAVDVTRIIEDAAAMCRPGAIDQRIELNCDLDLPSPMFANIDPFRLRQIMLNLIGNAVKFTEPGGTVRVRAHDLDGGRMLAVSVEDTGIGMSQATLAHLFEPFSQGDTSNTRRHGGTGLGLNITRAICRQMGGDVACRSELNIGSVFTVTLPLERLRDQERPTFRSTRPDTLIPSEGVGGHVLLAEDNEVNALVAEFALKRFGVQVETVGNGIDVVVRMCSTGPRPDLVLLDCQMPGMDGFEAARRVRAFEAEHGLERAPIVALTANVFQDDRERCREAGMDAFLGKPFTDQQLRDVLTMYLVLPADDSAPGDAVDSSYATRLA